MALPKFRPVDPQVGLLQTAWARAIDPVIQQPWNSGNLLHSVQLYAAGDSHVPASGLNTINHRLGRNLQGWVLIRLRASATIYDGQDSNPLPAQTLWLYTSANAVADLWVF